MDVHLSALGISMSNVDEESGGKEDSWERTFLPQHAQTPAGTWLLVEHATTRLGTDAGLATLP